MSLSETRRIFFLFLAAVSMVLILTLVPSHAYSDRGDVEIGSPGTTGNDSVVTPGTSDNNGTVQQYKINVASEEECHAILTCDKKEAAEGATVMIRATASQGYKLKGIIVTDSQGKTITTKGVGGIFELIMPASDVKVTSDVSEIVPVVEKEFPFTDVAADRWSRSSIEFVYNRDLFNGTSETLFSPEITMTRGMLVTVLYRLDDSPEVSGDSSFIDVDPEAYYAKAVKWASDHEIVLGMEEGIFAPNLDITREQLVTIMHRYAKYKGYNSYFSGILQDFTDSRTISEYAQTPFKWAYSKGIITGVTSNTLEPQGNATREQVATIVKRFVEKFVN